MKLSLLLISIFLSHLFLKAAAPTEGATNVSFFNIEGNQMLITFINGNGSSRIVVCREAEAVNGTPVNGADYVANDTYGLGNLVPGGAANNFVVGRLTGIQGFQSAVYVKGLTPNTVYHFSIFEFNGTGVSTEYLVTGAQVLTSNRSTQTTPGIQGSITGITQITGHSMKISLSPGNGSNRLLVCKKGGPVNVLPVNLVNYITQGNNYTSFTDATLLTDGNRAAWNTNNALNQAQRESVTIGNLDPNSVYHFALFEFNGTTGAVFNLINPFTISASTVSLPSVQPATLELSTKECNAATGIYTPGNGRFVMKVVKIGSPVDFNPANGSAYPYINVGGIADAHALGNGNLLLFNSFNNGVGQSQVTNEAFNIYSGLAAGSIVYAKVFEYNGNYTANFQPPVANTFYNIGISDSALTNEAPTLGPGNPSIDNIGATGLRINLGTPGNGTGRAILMREGTDFPANFSPSGCQYWGNISISTVNFGPGFGAIPDGSPNYIVYSGNGGSGTQINITGLKTGTRYFIRAYEYNRPSNQPDPANVTLYGITNAITSFYPTIAPSAFNYTAIDGDRFSANFTKGNGDNTIVLIKRSSTPASNPEDGKLYVSNNNYGQDNFATPPAIPSNRLEPLADSTFIIMVSAGISFDVQKLKPRTTYHIKAISYNGSTNGNSFYMCNAPAPGNGVFVGSVSTLSEPTIAPSNLMVTNIVADKATLNFTNGNGTGRLVFLKQGAPVDLPAATLADGAVFSANPNWTTNNNVYGNGNKCMGQLTGNINTLDLSGLPANTTFYLAIYEFNGLNYILYNQSASTSSFTTPTFPTSQASLNAYTVTEANQFIYYGSRGNGSNYLVLARAGEPVNVQPSDFGNQEYIANAAFGLGSEIGTGNFVIAQNSSLNNNNTLTGLVHSTTYHLAVFEYNKNALNKYFLTPGGVANRTTLSPPTLNSSSLQLNNITSSGMTITWTSGNGQAKLVILRPQNAVNKIPPHYSVYTGNPNFGSGTHLGENNYVVYSSNGNSVTVTGLAPNTQYHVGVYEYNGFYGPAYFEGMPLRGMATTISSPLNLSPLFNTNLCMGAPFTAIYTIGAVYNPGNIFTIQLSDASGNFTTPVTFGSQASQNEGNILCNVPYITAGANYKIRIVSSNPYFTSNELPANLVACTNPDNTAGCQTYTFNNVAGTPLYSIAGPNGMVMQIQTNNQDLGTVTVSVNKAPGPILIQSPGRYFMGRYYYISTTNSFSQPITIRLPFTQTELNEFNAADGTGDGITATPSNVVVSKYKGPQQDCSPLNNDFNNTTQSYLTPLANLTLGNGFMVECSIGSLSEFGIEDQNQVLPLKLLSLHAALKNKMHWLYWETMEELNVSHFEIQRNLNNTWETIGLKNSLGNGSHRYEFVATPVNQTNVLYRLKMVDKDGRFNFSKVVKLDDAMVTARINCYPNPAHSFIYFENAREGDIIRVMGVEGRWIKSMRVMDSNQPIRVNLSNLKPGLYFAEVTQPSGKSIIKFIIQ